MQLHKIAGDSVPLEPWHLKYDYTFVIRINPIKKKVFF